MKINFAWYADWVRWAIKRALTVPSIELAYYLHSILLPFERCIGVLGSMPFDRKGFALVFALIEWAKQNPDPLVNVHGAMQDARNRWP